MIRELKVPRYEVCPLHREYPTRLRLDEKTGVSKCPREGCWYTATIDPQPLLDALIDMLRDGKDELRISIKEPEQEYSGKWRNG